MVEISSNFIPEGAQLPDSKPGKRELVGSELKPKLSLEEVKKAGHLAKEDRAKIKMKEMAAEATGTDKPHTRAAKIRREKLLADAEAHRKQTAKEMSVKKFNKAGADYLGQISDEKKAAESEYQAWNAKDTNKLRLSLADRNMARKAKDAVARSAAKAEEKKMEYASKQKRKKKLITSSENVSVSGEINTDEEIELAEVDMVEEKENDPKLDRILEAYEEADNAGIFTEWMLENSDMALTKESVEKTPAIAKYLESNFQEQKLGVEYTDMLKALPTAQDYIDQARGKETRKTAEKKAITWKELKPKEQPEATKLKEVRDVISAVKEKHEEKDPVTVAEEAYVKAFREHDPGYTSNKSDKEIADKKPSIFAARELKNLYKTMLQARADNEVSITPEVRKSISEASRKSAVEKAELSSENIETIKNAAQKEEQEFVKASQEFAPQPAQAEAPQEISLNQLSEELGEVVKTEESGQSLTERYNKMPMTEGADKFVEERAAGIIKEINKTQKYFADKYKMSDEEADKFLMGEEIKGLFKGGQRLKQRQYKINHDSPAYKEWLKIKKNK